MWCQQRGLSNIMMRVWSRRKQSLFQIFYGRINLTCACLSTAMKVIGGTIKGTGNKILYEIFDHMQIPTRELFRIFAKKKRSI